MDATIQWLVDDMSDAINHHFTREERQELVDYLDSLLTHIAMRTKHDKSIMLGVVEKFLETPGEETR